ncbi:hypothetical protein B0H13DRAFT_2406699 [Mycena leptocephala]|nr:hypothetical protein B0H13DRAFT_2406699 [Mycena leptocephala]
MSTQAVLKDNSPAQTTGVASDAAPGHLNIAIVGAGPVGLAAAAMLRKEGHRITIFESSSFHAEIGAGLVLPPNGIAVLKKVLPALNWENMQTVDFRSVETWKVDGTHIHSDDLSEAWTMYPQGWFMIHRSDLHKELMRLALDPDAISHPPPAIRLGARITAINFDSEHPSVTTSSGEEFKFDLVLGADGIKSTVRKCMVGAEYDAPATHMASYRWMLDLKKNPELSWIRDDRKTPGLTAIIGGTKLRPGLLVYPVRRGDLVNLVAAHADTRDQLDAIDWNTETPMDTFLGTFEDFSDKFKALVAVAEQPRTWQVRQLPTLPTWIKGNVALLGDAAHAMLPKLGQGVSVGLEDAAALATLFPSGTKPSEIPSRLKAFEQIRKPRAERVSQMSSSQGRPSPNESFWIKPELFEYDAVAVTKELLSKF